MYLVSPTVWFLVGLLACFGAVVNAAGVVEIDLVFPRNETYAPTDLFPVVWAVQNAKMAKNLAILITSFVRGRNNDSNWIDGEHDLTYTNFSSEPYFTYQYAKLDTEGPYQVASWVNWAGCNTSTDSTSFSTNKMPLFVDFTIKSGAQQVDLVAATANGTTCSADEGVAINVTDQTVNITRSFSYPYDPNKPTGICAVLASSSPTPTANPCAVKVDTTVAASMAAWLHTTLCEGLNPPADCPKESHVRQLAVGGVVSFAAALGAIGFLLA